MKRKNAQPKPKQPKPPAVTYVDRFNQHMTEADIERCLQALQLIWDYEPVKKRA